MTANASCHDTPMNHRMGVRRRDFCLGLASISVTAALPAAAQDPFIKAELTKFIIQDMEFRFRNWTPPNNDRSSMLSWLNETNRGIDRLILMQMEHNLDNRLGQALNRFRSIAEQYRQIIIHNDLINVISAVSNSGPGGYGISSVIANNSDVINIGIDLAITFAKLYFKVKAINAGDMWKHGESISRLLINYFSTQSSSNKKEQITQAERIRLVQDFDASIQHDAKFMDESLRRVGDQLHNFTMPCFADAYTKSEYHLSLDRTPFALAFDASTFMRKGDIEQAAQCICGIAPRIHPTILNLPMVADYVSSFYLVAGHMQEFTARNNGNYKLYQSAIENYNAAFNLIASAGSKNGTPSYPYQVSYARSLAAAGQHARARTQALRVARLPIANTAQARALLEYDLASIYALLGEEREALDYLTKSYQTLPRRDPLAVQDPLLAPMFRKKSALTAAIVDPPLLGSWKSDSWAFNFYADGTVWQQWGDSTDTGNWHTENGNVLVLSQRSKLADSRSSFSINDNVLTLSPAQGGTYALRRVKMGLLGDKSTKTHSGRTLFSDGSWQWAKGGQDVGCRYATHVSQQRMESSYWHFHEDPMTGRVDEYVTQKWST